jgi:hypothetical protein
MSLTEFTADSLELERHIQRSLVVDGALFIRIAEGLVDQAQINPSSLRRLDSVQSTLLMTVDSYVYVSYGESVGGTKLDPEKIKGW